MTIALNKGRGYTLGPMIRSLLFALACLYASFTYASPAHPVGTYVGELQEKWQFPSDHLPIGITLNDTHIASWNVLDSRCMEWVIEKNSQGLSHSLIAEEHCFVEKGLTLRDRHVIELVLQMLDHPTHPRALLALQECSPAFIEALSRALPSHFGEISHGELLLLFDRSLFVPLHVTEAKRVFSEADYKVVQDVTLRQVGTEESLRLINAHLPGNPIGPARWEFAHYLAEHFDPALPTIAMGDMNFNEGEMSEAMDQAFGCSPFELYSPYCTNVNPGTFTSKAIDHFFVYGESATPDRPEEVLPGLEATLTLLEVPQYIQPAASHYIDAPLPYTEASNEIVGIYSNILYPQDRERLRERELAAWIEACAEDLTTPFPLSQEELSELSLYILERFPGGRLHHYFAKEVSEALAAHAPLEVALANAMQAARVRAQKYREIAQRIPAWEGQAELLAAKMAACAERVDQMLQGDIRSIRNHPERVAALIERREIVPIQPPFSWEMRLGVFEAMVEKITALSPNAPYFLALQEVTPQALHDMKERLAHRNLCWISFNHFSRKETLPPQQEGVPGEATSFTSTMALSPELEVLKVELGDLPTESGSIRKILGVRVRNRQTERTYDLFTTHTDHEIRRDIYARTAAKIQSFAKNFFKDTECQRFVIGGDLNAFEGSGGAQFLEGLRALLPGSRDFRETDYYAPKPIAWSSFIGRHDDTYSAQVAKEGTVAPNALDHILVGSGIELCSASREAGVYDAEGTLLDYYKERGPYLESLQSRITFSDHFCNIVRFR